MGYKEVAADDNQLVSSGCNAADRLRQMDPEDAEALQADLDNPGLPHTAVHRRLQAAAEDGSVTVGVRSVRNHRTGNCACQ